MNGNIRTIDGAAHFCGDFACPHCGHVNSHWFSWWSVRPEIVCCDCESGGCDVYFAVTAEVSVIVTATARKIDGIDCRYMDPVDPIEDEQVAS